MLSFKSENTNAAFRIYAEVQTHTDMSLSYFIEASFESALNDQISCF